MTASKSLPLPPRSGPSSWCSSTSSSGESPSASEVEVAPISGSTRARRSICGCRSAVPYILMQMLALSAHEHFPLMYIAPLAARRPDQQRAARRLDAHEMCRSSRARGQSGEVGEIHPTRTGAGSSAAVLSAPVRARSGSSRAHPAVPLDIDTAPSGLQGETVSRPQNTLTNNDDCHCALKEVVSPYRRLTGCGTTVGPMGTSAP